MLQTDYALRVLLYLGERPERHWSISEISRAHAISYHHLTKVARDLVKAGYLKSYRGRVGGIALARPATAISVGAVVRLMECDLDVVDCTECAIAETCGLKGVLNEAMRAFMGTLDRYSLHDLLARQETTRPPFTPIV